MTLRLRSGQEKVTRLMRTISTMVMMLLIGGCLETPQEQEIKQKQGTMNATLPIWFNTVILDSCEYIVMHKYIGPASVGGITHKGNCKFCQGRQ